ncbi:MAG: glycoside hydrolase family 2, partial [Bacteroidaceae bacterium]|nr:glycoside hydrolase family 2 [Bacteroidaceae bacterium]
MRKILQLIAVCSLWYMVACCSQCDTTTTTRTRESFDNDWLFMLSDAEGAETVEYDDTEWRKLNLPHDWAIEGDFSAENPSGYAGGALPGGVGWYRKHFIVDSADLSNGRRVYLDFDGVYMLSNVFVNGTSTGVRPYGYISFRRDITDLLHPGENVVAVRVDNELQPNSRWYSGCGIYRHVWL